MAEMRRQTLRFGESLWDLIEDEANRDGVSGAQWIRDAALARAMWERQRRGESDGVDVLRAIRQEHRAEDERQQQAIREILGDPDALEALEQLIDRVPPGTAHWIRALYGL
jgi:hypothetical protein